MTVTESRAVGRPKKDVDAVSMRLEKDAYELSRQAAALHGESIVVYVSRIARERAESDLLEAAKKRVKDAEKGGKKGAK